MTTQDIKDVTEEQEQIKKDDETFKELNKKEDRTNDEEKELGEIKERYGKRMQKRVDELNWKAKSAEEETRKEKEERQRLETEVAELKRKTTTPAKPLVKEEFVEIGGKKYLTNEALVAKMNAGEITEQEAYKYERTRDREEDKHLLREEIKQEKVKESAEQVRFDDAQQVLKEYPQFAKNHSSFNPEDPLYKLTTEIYSEGYAVNPRGLSLAIKRAKQILKMTDTTVDKSDELNLDVSTPPERIRRKEQEITLDEDEKEAAERMYRDIINLKTGRTYTEKETHAKALEAKKIRGRR